MQNLEQRVAERRDMATNMQELREAYNWLAEETYAVANANMQLEAAIIEKYGAKALIELQDKDISAERINTDYKMLLSIITLKIFVRIMRLNLTKPI